MRCHPRVCGVFYVQLFNERDYMVVPMYEFLKKELTIGKEYGKLYIQNKYYD